MADLDFWGVLNKVMTQFPQFIPILTKPGIFDILAKAFNTPEDWPPARIDAEIHNTEYVKTTPQSQRDWDALALREPATVKQRLQTYETMVNDMMRQTGVTLKRGEGWDMFASDYWNFLNRAAANQWTPDQLKSEMTTWNQFSGLLAEGGEIGTNAVAAKRMADDYGLPMSDQAAKQWGVDLTRGTVDAKALQGYLINTAKSFYPGIVSMLDKGHTVRQIADPYLQVAQQELGTDPDTISLADPKWHRALSTVDPTTGNRVSMSLSDWTKTVRSDEIYGYDKTPQARKQGAEFAGQLSKMMGALG